MHDAAARIADYIGAGGEAEFMRQTIVYDAVRMNLLRIGECARFLSPGLKSRLPDIPWPDLVSLRNRLAHSYETLTPSLLWLIASSSVPDAIATIEAELSPGKS